MQPAERQRHLGTALLGLENGDYQQVDAACTPLFSRDGIDLEALLLLGYAAAARGESARAAAILDRVARERPRHPHPCADLVCALPKVPRSRIAAQFQASLRLAPEDHRLRSAFAGFLLEGDQADQAVPVLEAWLRHQPSSAAAHIMLGMAHSELGQFDAACSHFRTATRLAPDQPACWTNLGMLLKTLGDLPAALAAHAEALNCSPDDPRIRVNRAVALLQAGQWDEAWPEFEWRLRLPGYRGLPLDRLLPGVTDCGALQGRVVLLTHEDGFGDTIQMLRYVPLLAERGVHVRAWVPAPLESLVGGVAGIEHVLVGDMAPPRHDFHCPFVSLPRVFRSTPATVPNQPYLAADPVLAAQWAAGLPAKRLLVGLAWAGQSRPWLPGFAALDRRRSAGLAALAPLAEVPGVQFVSLQKGPAAADAAVPPPGMHLLDVSEALGDFGDSAALIANLDLVVSVDTAVAHLAGAMGKPVFLLDRYDNCWRWLSGRSDSPWYPSLTIFRQTRPGDWAQPIARAAAALQAMAAFHGATPLAECAA